MTRAEAVTHALHSMELEGFCFTSAERRLWAKIGRGELPLSAVSDAAAEFDRLARLLCPQCFEQE